AVETIAGWLVPQNIIGNIEVVRPKEGLEQTLSAARSLALISDGPAVTAIAEVPDTLTAFADLAHRHLCELPRTDANAVVLKVYAWFVLRADRDAASLHRRDRDGVATCVALTSVSSKSGSPSTRSKRTRSGKPLRIWVLPESIPSSFSSHP